MEVVPTIIMTHVFMEFGKWKKGTLVCDEEDLAPMMDRLFYDKKWNGKGVVKHYLEQKGSGDLTSQEIQFVEAMKTNIFSLFLVVETNSRTKAVLLRDILGQDMREFNLVDIGMSETMKKGALLASRIINIGEFHMTTGVAHPFNPEHEFEIFEYLKENRLWGPKMRKTARDGYPLAFYKMRKIFSQNIVMEFGDVE
jgi:hypothetical protein